MHLVRLRKRLRFCYETYMRSPGWSFCVWSTEPHHQPLQCWHFSLFLILSYRGGLWSHSCSVIVWSLAPLTELPYLMCWCEAKGSLTVTNPTQTQLSSNFLISPSSRCFSRCSHQCCKHNRKLLSKKSKNHLYRVVKCQCCVWQLVPAASKWPPKKKLMQI